MNVFGAFNFGSLIKTFLPGLVLFFVLLVYLELFAFWIHKYIGIFTYLMSEPLVFTIVAIPVSVILGVTLNSIVFSGVSEFILEDRYEKENKPLFELRKLVTEKVNEKLFRCFSFHEEYKDTFKKIIDPRFFFLQKQSLENLMYLRESYWYYMEFQLNTLVAISIGMPAFISTLIVIYNQSIINLSALTIVIISLVLFWLFFGWLCMKSAEYNLDAHRKKELSLLLGVIYFEIKGDDESKKI